MKKINYLSVLLLVLLITFSSCYDNQRAKNYNEKTLVDDYGLNFINTVAEGGLTEIKASTVAQNTSQNPRVTAFAKMMIADHTKVSNELSELAKIKFVDKATKINEAHQAMIDSLSKLSGAGFDQAYMEMMVKDHEAAVKLFAHTSSNKNRAVRDLARKFLPTIKMHLDSAKAINAGLK